MPKGIKGPIRRIRVLGEYQSLVKAMRLTQSISRRGNWLDNAPIQLFSGHFKDDVDYKEAANLFELKVMVDEYIDHYNGTRKQRD